LGQPLVANGLPLSKCFSVTIFSRPTCVAIPSNPGTPPAGVSFLPDRIRWARIAVVYGGDWTINRQGFVIRTLKIYFLEFERQAYAIFNC
jgi:hypothetical protein